MRTPCSTNMVPMNEEQCGGVMVAHHCRNGASGLIHNVGKSKLFHSVRNVCHHLLSMHVLSVIWGV